MFSGIWRRRLTDWGGRRSSIVVVSLEEFLDVLDCIIISIQDIFVSCRNVE